ncbi:PKD domain-containing protein, partial [Salmonella enterica]|uniref:PKD domain-containing protein n=1 Tax=Salmonella enterica TaxID=28901 RepID=UPI0020A4D9BB
STQGIQAIVYGYDEYESFGYSAGVRVQVPFLSIYDTTRAYCPSDTVYIALGVSDTSRIIYSEWDLGDGSPHLFDTFSFWHVYPTYGDYPVKFI